MTSPSKFSVDNPLPKISGLKKMLSLQPPFMFSSITKQWRHSPYKWGRATIKCNIVDSYHSGNHVIMLLHCICIWRHSLQQGSIPNYSIISKLVVANRSCHSWCSGDITEMFQWSSSQTRLAHFIRISVTGLQGFQGSRAGYFDGFTSVLVTEIEKGNHTKNTYKNS